MSDFLLALIVSVGVLLLAFIVYRLFVAIILYRYVVDTSKEVKKNDSRNDI